MAQMKALPEGFTIIKQGIGFHIRHEDRDPELLLRRARPERFHGQLMRGMLTEKGLNHVVACVTR